jgi:DNA gyrase inhibitor GyrI
LVQLGRQPRRRRPAHPRPPFVIYHKIDPRNMHFNCDMAIPVNADNTSSDLEVKTFPGGRYYKTTLKGSYEFHELAWYQAYSHLRMLKLKPQSRHAALEIYENDPSRVAHSNEILTSILVPIK